MKISHVLKEIHKTENAIQNAQQNLNQALGNLSDLELEEPYCYLAPAFAFLLGYQLSGKITLDHTTRYLFGLIRFKSDLYPIKR